MNNIRKTSKMKVLRKGIFISWGILILCMIVKLLGGNYFEIAVNNKNFISVCNFIDNSFILKYGLRYLSYLFVMMTISLALIDRKTSKKDRLIWILILICITSTRAINLYLGSILDILYFIVLSYIYDKKILKGAFAPLLMTIFQSISLITRNLGIQVVESNSLTEIILSIDYYIMIILYYLYSEVRRSLGMGWFGGILFAASEDWLRAKRNKIMSKLEAKEGDATKLESKLEAINKELARRAEGSK